MERAYNVELPRKNDFVIGVVSKITSHGIYVKLKEYETVESYCHISEIAGTWIRNIRNFVRIDQQVVAKVLRVQSDTGQVDISLKRVSDQIKKDKISEFKRQNAAVVMVNLVAEKSEKSEDEIRTLIEDKFIDTYGSMFNGFEELTFVGLSALEGMEIDENLATIMHEVAEISIQISIVSITADMGIRSFAPDGVVQVKKLLYTVQKVIEKYPDIISELTTIGAPMYRLYLQGKTVMEVNDVYDRIVKTLELANEKLDVEYRIERKDNR